MTDREQVEELVKRGTWVWGYCAARLRQSDGTVLDWIEIDPKLNPTQKRVWAFFCKNQRWSSAEFDKMIEQGKIADWRRRAG